MFDPWTPRYRPSVLAALVVGLALWAGSGFLAIGCGATAAAGGGTVQTSLATTSVTSEATSTRTTTSAASDSTTSTTTPAMTERTPEAAFAYLSERLDSIPVYSPTYLPADTTLAATWWPVTQLQRSSDYHGADLENPRVDEADGTAVAAQVVLAVGKGWLAVLENYRGDLGDVAGEVVGNVQGNRATLYSVGGGTTVQWSDGGLWFVVFGGNLSGSEVTKVALSMGKTMSDSGSSQ